ELVAAERLPLAPPARDAPRPGVVRRERGGLVAAEEVDQGREVARAEPEVLGRVFQVRGAPLLEARQEAPRRRHHLHQSDGPRARGDERLEEALLADEREEERRRQSV